MYEYVISYGDRVQKFQYFLTVTFKPEIVSFQRAPEFVSVSKLNIITGWLWILC